jgi:hypothetical protein
MGRWISFGVDVCDDDVRTLGEGAWVNDAIVGAIVSSFQSLSFGRWRVEFPHPAVSTLALSGCALTPPPIDA